MGAGGAWYFSYMASDMETQARSLLYPAATSGLQVHTGRDLKQGWKGA
jgi:hypothetical protein